MLNSNFRAYALRRVNPFLGVMQVVETDAGRATSTNGVVWDIEVLAEVPGDWGSLNVSSKKLAYYHFGLWSLDEGLCSRPLAPQIGNDSLLERCEVVVGCIKDCLTSLPFELQDTHELWLFDMADEQPLVLLDSQLPDGERPFPEPRYWSACFGANGVASQRKFPAARELEAAVKRRAGFNINRHWIIRQPDGDGLIEDTQLKISMQKIPTYLVTENWEEEQSRILAGDYIEWISPSLLTLQHLSQAERDSRESALGVQAISIEHHWHLYPEISDEQKIRAARVQCRMQKASLNVGEGN